MQSSFFDLRPQPCCVLARNGIILRTNQAWKAAFPPRCGPTAEQIRLGAQGGDAVNSFCCAGSRWFRWFLTPDEQTGHTYTLGVDITAERDALTKLELLDQFLPGVAFLYRTYPDQKGRFEYVSNSVKKMYGVDPETVYANPAHLFALIYRPDLHAFFKQMETCEKEQKSGGIEFRVKTPQGVRYIRGTWNPAPQPDGSTLWTGVYMDIHAARLTADRLREASDRFELAVRGSNDGIWEYDVVKDCFWISARWKAILGFKDEEIPATRKTWRGLMIREDREDAIHRVREFIHGRTSEFLATHRYHHKDGSIRHLLTRAALLRDDNGRPMRITGAVTDITELIKAREDAEAASRAKSAFLANMSHEIRTPMNGVLGMAQILEASDLSADQRHYVRAIGAGAESLLVILNDILDLSKIEAGKLAIDRRPTDAEDVLKSLSRMYQPLATQKGLEFKMEIPRPLAHLMIDPVRVRQIATNLIGNALKFTHEGSITLRAEYNDGKLRVSVKDTGVGIPPSRQKSIFEAFSQADNSTSRMYGGTGLGLSIAIQLLDLMSGRMSLTSRVGEGSEFTFELPAEECSPEVCHAFADELPDPSLVLRLSGLVLLAEDNEVNVLVAQTVLEDLGIKVDVANNGVEAVDKCEKGSYDLVLMDLHMPIMDGADAAKRIRQMEGTRRRTPIVAISAAVRDEDRQTCAEAGMDDFITKPFAIADLRRVLQKFLGAKAA